MKLTFEHGVLLWVFWGRGGGVEGVIIFYRLNLTYFLLSLVNKLTKH